VRPWSISAISASRVTAAPSLKDDAPGVLTVRANVQIWDLRVVLDTVARYGGRMVITQRVVSTPRVWNLPGIPTA
jgi:hypothetical protein